MRRKAYDCSQGDWQPVEKFAIASTRVEVPLESPLEEARRVALLTEKPKRGAEKPEFDMRNVTHYGME